MRIDLTDVSPVKKTMTIEVPPEEVDRETASVLRSYAAKANIPGFRKGKVLLDVIRKRFAKEVEDDVRERVLQRCYREATREKGLRPIGQPVLDEVHQKEGEPLSFKTTFEVLPEVEPKGYKGVEVRRPAVTVGEDEVEKMLEELRQSKVRLVTEEGRAAEAGDVILADVAGTPEGGEPFSRERMLIEVGASDNLPAFNEHLHGVQAGAEPEFSVDYPEGYGSEELAGKTVRYRLVVHEIKRRELPELDDEFAKDLGEFDDLAALRAKIREDLGARKEAEADREVRQAILDKMLIENPIVLPDLLVDEEIRHRLEDLVRSLYARGMDPEKMELDWKDIRQRQEEPARKSVHARLVLDAIARVESIEVSGQEVEERIRRDARAIGEKPEVLKKRVREQGGMQALKSQLVREKSLDLLVAVANIQKGSAGE